MTFLGCFRWILNIAEVSKSDLQSVNDSVTAPQNDQESLQSDGAGPRWLPISVDMSCLVDCVIDLDLNIGLQVYWDPFDLDD